MRRFAVIVTLFAAAAGLRCSTYHLPPVPEPPDYCITPTGPYWRPVVCVDDSNLMANPKVQIASDVEPAQQHGKTPSNRPVSIFWRTHRQFNLQLDFPDKSCVDQVTCNGQGHCQAVIRPLEMVNGVRQNRRCTYRMFDGANPQKPGGEADLVVTACCWQ